MQQLRDIDCYMNGLYYYYTEIVSTAGVCDAKEFDLLADFKIRLDEFNASRTNEEFRMLCLSYENFYQHGYLRKRFMRYDLQEQFDCVSELMMRLKRIYV